MKCIYGLFGFEFHLELSTRPENYLGQVETWNFAEEVYQFADSLYALKAYLFLATEKCFG